jgi:perosamine synthetase
MADMYRQGLDGVPGIQLPIEKPWAHNVYWMYAILVMPEFGCSRDELMERLKARGIDTRSFFFPMHVQPVFKKMGLFREECYPIAERLSQQGMYLPSGLTMTEEQISQVADAVRTIHREVNG